MPVIPQHICFVNTHKEWGGGEKWHFEMAVRLHHQGFHVRCIVAPGSAFAQKLEQTPIPYYTCAINNLSFLNGKKLRHLIRIFQAEYIEVVILNLSSDLKTGGLAARKAGVNHIIYRRGSAIPIRNSFLNRYLFKHVVTAIIANSTVTKETILQNNRRLFDKNKIFVIHNGIDLKAYDDQNDTPLINREKNEMILGNAGRMVKQKGQWMLIDIAAELKSYNLNFKLLIAGEGKLKKTLESYARQKDVADNIYFMDFVQNMRGFMNTLDVFLLPSLWEGFGYVLIEAMASQTPVVAFKTSSNPEIINDETTGYLVQPYDLREFAGKTIKLADPAIASEMGIAGRKWVENHFTFEHTVAKIKRMLEQISTS